MKNFCILPMLAVAALGLAAGCGGGSGSSSSGAGAGLGGNNVSKASVQGVWNGTTSSANTGVTGAGNLEIDFTQSGTAVSGTAMLTQAQLSYSGPVSGTVNGSNATVTVDYGSLGKTVYTLAVNGSSITGTYVLSAPSGGATIDSGNANLAKAGVTTANITNTYTGTYQAGGSPTFGLAYYIIQNGDTFTVTALLNGTTTYVGTGTIIGNSLSFQATQQGGNGVIHVTGTVNGSTITGKLTEQGSIGGHVGDPIIFNFTVAVALHA